MGGPRGGGAPLASSLACYSPSTVVQDLLAEFHKVALKKKSEFPEKCMEAIEKRLKSREKQEELRVHFEADA